MPAGQENPCLLKPNGTARRTELLKVPKEPIPGEVQNQTRTKATLIFTAGTPHASAHFHKDRAPSEFSTCWAMDGSGPPACSSPSPDSKHFPFTAATRQISLMASTTSSKEAPRARPPLCCAAHFATGFNRTTNTFTQGSVA